MNPPLLQRLRIHLLQMSAVQKAGSTGKLMIEAVDHIAELEAKIEGFEVALHRIAAFVDCEGPGCIWCEGDEQHPLSAEARIALDALTPPPASPA